MGDIQGVGYNTDPGLRYEDLNQDRYLAIKSNSGEYLFAVFDGHCKQGEIAAQIARDTFEKYFLENLVNTPENMTLYQVADHIKRVFEVAHNNIIDKCPQLTTLDVKGRIYRLTEYEGRMTYKYTNSKLGYLQDFGTTAVVCWIKKSKSSIDILFANAGDSAAFIGRQVTHEVLEAVTGLTEVHCVSTNHDELLRVSKFGMERTEGPYIAPPKSSGINMYEIAMTRALGHQYLVAYGLTYEPYIKIDYKVQANDKYVILSSDGVTDVLEPNNIFQIISQQDQQQSLHDVARVVVDESLKAWKCKYPNPGDDPAKIADNTTIIIVDLNKLN